MCIRDSSRKACFGATSMVSAGGGSHASLWVAGGLLSQSRLLCNLLDGMVAGELRGKGEYHNKMGHVYNELPDRVSDAAMLIGLGYAAGHPLLGDAAAVAAIMTAYTRSLGGESGAGQQFGGIMPKPVRGALVFGCALGCGLAPSVCLPMHVPTVTLGIVCAGSVQTTVLRLQRIQRTLDRPDPR
eukprot:TRINITY_DN27712_c0_g1_i2.p1 TRINITY_DN27712_c0_g1~~TRINITY_DN27712_c0_g1_i2.p1  ORF type:complete len:185 (+),score=36.05 TRINITY_DN27712_c0_g1_i2:177-731(+)